MFYDRFEKIKENRKLKLYPILTQILDVYITYLNNLFINCEMIRTMIKLKKTLVEEFKKITINNACIKKNYLKQSNTLQIFQIIIISKTSFDQLALIV